MKHPNKIGSPYWICYMCAKEFGGKPFKEATTAAHIICEYCKGENQIEAYCFPTVDYKWSKEGFIKSMKKK